MLPGFEIETAPLTEYEKETLLPVFIKGLSKKLGVDAAVTNKKMVRSLKEKGYEVSDVRVRKIINHIRNEALIPGLVASSKGYYVTTDPQELRKYISSLEGRESAIRSIKLKTLEYYHFLISPKD